MHPFQYAERLIFHNNANVGLKILSNNIYLFDTPHSFDKVSRRVYHALLYGAVFPHIIQTHLKAVVNISYKQNGTIIRNLTKFKKSRN